MTKAMREMLRELLGKRDIGPDNYYVPPKQKGALIVSKADLSAAMQLSKIGVVRLECIDGQRRAVAARDWTA